MKSEIGEWLEFEALRVIVTIVESAGLGRLKENVIFKPFFSNAVISGIPPLESIKYEQTCVNTS